MDINSQKEQFSIAYIHAVCSAAGFSCTKPTVDDHSIDLDIKSSDRPYKMLSVQLKATANSDYVKDGYIHYPLPIKNYNDLRGNDITTPRYLVCLLLPSDDPASWTNQSIDNLIIMKCAYWLSLKDYDESENGTSVTVKIPLKNIFTPDFVKDLIDPQAKSLSKGVK